MARQNQVNNYTLYFMIVRSTAHARYMAVASGPAGPVLAGPVLTVAFSSLASEATVEV